MLPIEMIPASELPVSELTDAELDVVCGGIFDTTTLVATNTAVNIASPVVSGNIFAGPSGPSAVANVSQGINQSNFSAAFLQSII